MSDKYRAIVESGFILQIDDPGLARSMGWWAEGPIENADDLQPALERAVAQVKTGKPALVDAVTQHR